MKISTRSRIGILKRNGKVETIYCHFDGYIEYNGRMLDEFYNDLKKIKELIKLGDISSLKENINPNPKMSHSFDEPQEDVVVAYHRDRDEDWKYTKPKIHNNIDELNEYIDGSDIEYIYLYDIKNKKWLWDFVDFEKNKMELKDLDKTIKDITKVALKSGDFIKIFKLNEVPFFNDLKKSEIQVKVDNDVYEVYESTNWEDEKKIVDLIGRDIVWGDNDPELNIKI